MSLFMLNSLCANIFEKLYIAQIAVCANTPSYVYPEKAHLEVYVYLLSWDWDCLSLV